MTKEYLLQQVWETCSFNEIINTGITKGFVDSKLVQQLENIKDESYKNGYLKGYDTGYNDALEVSGNDNTLNGGPDDLWRIFCDNFKISYYDNKKFKECFNEILGKLNKSIYKDTDIKLI